MLEQASAFHPGTAGRRSIVIIENFYQDPEAVRAFALRQTYYPPYQDSNAVRQRRARATWWTSRFQNAATWPFKATSIIERLAWATGERIDQDHWHADYPLYPDGKPRLVGPQQSTCLWNTCFHVKPSHGQQLGAGVHNHVVDAWNSVGPDGWAGIVYLSPDAPLDGGLYLWRNHDPHRQYDWMTGPEHWTLVDRVGNVYNRLVLCRGDLPHSGADGWGESLETGRLYQTFFFRTGPDACEAEAR